MPSFNIKDVAAGAVFAAIGLAFLAGALMLDIGSPFKMGPGFFPLILSGLLVLLGLATAAKAANIPSESIGTIPWRALPLILAAPLLFGATVRGLGLLITLPLTILLAAAASRRVGMFVAAALMVGLTLFCVLVFSFGLGLPLPLVGTWLS